MAEPRTFSIDEVDGFVNFIQNVSIHFYISHVLMLHQSINYMVNQFFIDPS